MQDRIGISFVGIAAAVVPFLCGVLSAMFANIPVAIFGIPSPLLAFIPVYFWCLMRPDLMPPWAAFAIGAVQDLLCGGPMGVWATAFAAAYALLDRERDAFAGLAGIGAVFGFGAAILVVGGVAFGLTALIDGRFPPAEPLILMMVMTVLFYVPSLWILELLYRGFVGPLRGET